MKNVKKSSILTFLLLLGAIFSFDASAISRDEMYSMARLAANKAAEAEMNKISPNTGKDPNYELIYDSFTYSGGVIECSVNLSWSAKNQMIFGTRKTCRCMAKMKIYSDGSYSYSVVSTNDWYDVCKRSHLF